MKTLGVLGVVLPETCQPGLTALERLLKAEQDAGIAPDPIRRLAALLPPHVDTAEALAARLRLSRSQRARLVSLAERGPAELAAPSALAYVAGPANACGRLLLQPGDLAPLTGW